MTNLPWNQTMNGDNSIIMKQDVGAYTLADTEYMN
jgi:hypothetical protein